MGHHRKYTDMLGYASPTARNVVRAKDIVAALAPPQRSLALVKDQPAVPPPATIAVSMIPSAIGAVVGFSMWKKHRVLGVIAGAGIAEEGYRFVKGDRKTALCNLAVEGAGIFGALQFKSTMGRILGFVGGSALGAVATSFVDGSPASKVKAKLKKDWAAR